MRKSSWDEFTERPVSEFEMDSPAEQVGSLLRRYRADLDAAARASAEGRAEGMAALAEQAALAAELSKRLEDHVPGDADPSTLALLAATRDVRDRMLAHVAATGLEIVRLAGADATEIAGLADVESWHYDHRFDHEVVLEEIEVAVCHLGVPIRRGRVVMGAPPDGGPTAGGGAPAQDAAHVAPPSPHAAGRAAAEAGTAAATIVCPVADCRAVNDADADVCAACLTDLVTYRRLSLFPQTLFNRGLRAARAGDPLQARDCFAAVVLWCPDDHVARNAYALVCLESGDTAAARGAWDEVLARSPTDRLATAGLRRLADG